MRSRGSLAVLLVFFVACTPLRARAADNEGSAGGECVLPTSPPEGSARLRWRAPGTSEGAPGFWISDKTMQRFAARVETCVDGWAKCQVDLSVEKGKAWKPGWKAWTIGIATAIALGFGGGFVFDRVHR